MLLVPCRGALFGMAIEVFFESTTPLLHLLGCLKIAGASRGQLYLYAGASSFMSPGCPEQGRDSIERQGSECDGQIAQRVLAKGGWLTEACDAESALLMCHVMRSRCAY